MIDLYTSTTPNGRKLSILLEELGVEYRVIPVELSKGEQFAPAFGEISPNHKIPAIVDRDNDMHLMESGAIMLYLADKFDRFRVGGKEHWRMVEWLMWQMGGIGPMLGQVHHFVKYNRGKSEYAEQRFLEEARRLYRVLDTRLEGRDYVVGEERGTYTITDMAIWPWISRFEWHLIDLREYPSLMAWYVRLAERPAVQRGYHVPKFVNEVPMP